MSDLYIMHYGVGHDKGGHSGRYPWGSGEDPYQGMSPAERRKAKLDKYWYHRGAKTRLGIDHIKDIDPNTKFSDLFKYNKRSTADVLADKILTDIYGDTEMPRDELRRKKYNLMSVIQAAEAGLYIAALVNGLSAVKIGARAIEPLLNKNLRYVTKAEVGSPLFIKGSEGPVPDYNNNPINPTDVQKWIEEQGITQHLLQNGVYIGKDNNQRPGGIMKGMKNL